MKEMNLEIGMKNRQVMLAMTLAQGKERFFYYSLLSGSLAILLPIAAIKTHDPKKAAPLVPLALLWTF